MKPSVVSRNWLGYLCDSLVTSGAMSTWDATDYLTENLFGESPNPRLHEAKAPYETTSRFLHHLYSPIVEAATRAVNLPSSSMIHIFTDISLIGNSAVLVVYFPGENRPHQLLLLDGVRAWDLVFPDAEAFNIWAEERFGWTKAALETAAAATQPASATAVNSGV
ncbi:MAG: hypothetical protein EPO64_05265 [Nitrospirae bacterium]|nr:MAG: hypothetical protein EPO64_05265 [Nitrospirota bacterium]